MTFSAMDAVMSLGVAAIFGSLLALGVAVRSSAAAAVRMRPSLELARTLMFALFVDGLVNFFAVIVIVMALVSPSVVSLLLVPLALVSLLPYPFARIVAVPLGQAPLAWSLSLLSCWRFWEDRRGAAVGIAAWALARRARPDPARVAWLEQQLAASSAFVESDKAPGPWLRRLFFFVPEVTRANALFGGGLIAAAAGDLDGARAILARLDRVPATAFTAEARRLAASWRIADALERGDWSLASRLAAETGQAFVAVAARRMADGPEAVGDDALRASWNACRDRARLAPLLERALTPQGLPSAPAPPPTSASEALRQALAAHLTLSRGTPSRPGEALRRLAASWEAVLDDDELRRGLADRAQSLGVPGGVAVIEDVGVQVEQLLAELARRDGVPLDELVSGGPLLRRVARSLRDGLLAELDGSVQALGRRVEDDRRLPGEVEKRELDVIIEQYRRVGDFGGIELRRLAFSQMHATVCSFGVWLWNERRQRRVGNAVFRFLFREALVLEDESALMLQAGNVRAGAG